MSQSKGYQRERELVNAFYNAEFAVTRVPKSGGSTKRPLPDILASNGEYTYAIEAKARKESPIYLTGKEIEDLVWFARTFGAKPRIGARFNREDWSFFHPGDLYVTDSGNYRIKKETAIVEGSTFDQLASNTPRVTLADIANIGTEDRDRLEILRAVKDGELSPKEALKLLS